VGTNAAEGVRDDKEGEDATDSICCQIGVV